MSATHILNVSNGVVLSRSDALNATSRLATTTSTTPSEQGIKVELSQAKISPSHKLALTGSQCYVCGDQAPTEGGFRKHYGVICCEACKCFFRRTVQMSRDYKCRFGGKCAVGRTAINLKQICQACRFNQCLKAGMKIESVKKFPRKVRDDSKKGSKKQVKTPKDKTVSTSNSTTSVTTTSNGVDPKYSQSNASPQSIKSESDIEELSQLKFNVSSPEMLMLENANVRQLFSYDSLENVNCDSGGSPATSNSIKDENGENNTRVVKATIISANALTSVAKSVTIETSPTNAGESQSHSEKDNAFHFPTLSWKGTDHLSLPSGHSSYAIPTSPSKRPRIESASSAVDMMSYHSSPYSGSLGSHSAPHTPLPHYNPSQPSSRVTSPDPGMSSVYNSHNNTPFATPSHTPTHSPLPSPTSHPANFFQSQGNFPSNFSSQSHGGIVVPPSTSSLQPHHFTAPPSGVSQLTLPGFTPSNNLLALQQTGNTILLPNSQMPFGMAPLFPVVQFNPFSSSTLPLSDSGLLQSRIPQVSEGEGGSASNGNKYQIGKSPFRIIPIPSINKIQPPEDPECAEVSAISNREAELLVGGEGMMSAPPSARSSPVLGKPKSRASLPEANVEEVLESLRLRIRSMFKWAKSEVTGFDDLSPLDQKALLRKTVAELVMLGFARGSIAYENVLLLGSTGAVLKSSNHNPGIASVASVTLEKLVVPLKVLNISDKELRLLKEIVLFNPEANGLRNREIVRQYRKRKHIELMEHTEKHSDDPGRFGDLMCLLTPLFEVGMEVTEQLRLEQFVHEGEARIDALLLMSMISGAEEMPAESTVDQ